MAVRSRGSPAKIAANPANEALKLQNLFLMHVLFLTMFLSTMLGGLFAWLFLRDWRKHPFASAERASLLPLEEEKPVAARKTPPSLPRA